MSLNISVVFQGGLDNLFSKKPSHKLTIPATSDGKPANLTYLIFWLRDNLLSEREELFIQDGTVRPGILVLVNEVEGSGDGTDWELLGEGDYELKSGDEIIFISTLHGG
ncbi:ubiquitin-like modifier 1 [Cristinia sonorae]|uniref:Ubiquitin-related modifier 1 n=1 Tax=Cristinia sonorae TaxID=1940300 RepID=A0A8K0UTG0_9AGAR|nr:ubiquitin-like modifier 1 [Cristinia sonorae]